MFNHRVAFVHPDLGIGGAERLVVDAAVGLRRLGAQVTIFTSHYDPTHAFEQTRELDVRVYGDWLPRSFFGRFAALCAYIRSVYLAIMILLFGGKISVFFCDSISIAIPVLQLKAPVLFYCHFPDKLLTQRTSFLKLIYRMPLDLAEQLTTGLAQLVLVNSHFTARQYASAFPLLRWCCPPPQVLYPAVDVEQLGDGRAGGTTDTTSSTEREESDWAAIGLPVRPRFLLLSINRFERKKNVGLAVLALAKLRDQLATTPTTTGATGSVVAGFHNNNNSNNNNNNSNNNNNNSNSNNNNSPDDDYDFFKHVHLVLAGGYDTRVAENVEHAAELELLAARLGVADHVTQLRSCSSDTKLALLRRCLCLLYTPENEHFGIVPLEAMSVGRPVIALNSGGPTETVEADWPGKCGFLCNARQDEPASEEKDARIAAEMATHLRELVLDPARASLIGANGIARVSLFGLAAFSTELLRFTQAVSRERRSVLMRMCGLVALAPLLVYPVVAAMVSSFFFSFFA